MSAAATALLLPLGISLLVQAIFFAFAATLKTDKVTDLSYGLTFVMLALYELAALGEASVPARLLTAMVVLWGVRLASYLLYRILTIKRDSRFDGVREHFWKFLQFWFFQGIAVWVIMLPVIVWFRSPSEWHPAMLAGVIVWFVGLVLETIADAQKFAQKATSSGARTWTSTGLWKYSRHPNYFGEMLCWWGVFLFVAPALSPLDLGIAVIGPIAITYILLYVTGIPTLEKSAQAKWGNDPEYQAYRRRTWRLVPWPVPRKS
jgi:steroid 5-alpha reductase family enzyme